MGLTKRDYGPRKPITLPDGTKTKPFHAGMDFGGGGNIIATHSGTAYQGYDSKSGYYVYVISDPLPNGTQYVTIYAHMKQADRISDAARVNRGDILGVMGETGAAKGVHVHYEVRTYQKDKHWINMPHHNPADFMR